MSTTQGYGPISQAFIQEYSSLVLLALQQKGSVLRNLVTEQALTGKGATMLTRFNSTEAEQVTGKYQPIVPEELQAMQRWVFPSAYDKNLMIDKFDEVKLINDPTGQYVTSAAYAIGRAIDRSIMSAFFGAAATGNNGSSPIAFPTSTNQIVVGTGASSATGINVTKLLRAKELLANNYVDPDTPLMAIITPTMERQLLQQTQVISTEYTDRPVLDQGRVKSFLGIDFIVTPLANQIFIDSNGYYNMPVFTREAMGLGLWRELNTYITQRNDLRLNPWQLSCSAFFGATRLDENQVMQIQCTTA